MDTIRIGEFPLTVNGRDYYVNEAVIETEVEATGYEFNPRAFVGRDIMEAVPQKVVSMEIVNNHSEDELIYLADLVPLRDAILDIANEQCRKRVGYGRWM